MSVRVTLQRLREAKGYTQQTFSAAVKVSRSHYSQIETGDKPPSFQLALRIKRQLGYYGDDLFDNVLPSAAGRNFFATDCPETEQKG